MFSHPGILILKVWALALSVLIILPFSLAGRVIYWQGYGILICFLVAFCLGSITKIHLRRPLDKHQARHLSFVRADFLLMTLGVISICVFTIELLRSGGWSMSVAYESRSSQAQALLHGGLSNSSLWFKVGFLTYPASLVYLVRVLVFDPKLRFGRIIVFGVAPAVLAAATMGGRSPLFLIISLSVISYAVRRRVDLINVTTNRGRKRSDLGLFSKFVVAGGLVAAAVYAINVFIERASAQGGLDVMFSVAEDLWGVTFSGFGFEIAADIFGPGPLFIIFVLSWYFVQGIVISSSVLANYNGPALLGVYGIDLASALARRIDAEETARRFNYLLELDTYGFFPSAFGTLFVDFSYAGILITFGWGAFAGLVHRRFRFGRDPRWRLFAPFTVFGICISIINTPLGFGNGFVMYVWLFIVFFLIRTTFSSRLS